MKRSLLPVLAGLGLCLAQISAHAQDYKEHISKQFTLQGAASGTTLAIYNIWGSITIQGYSGSQVSIEVDETIRGKRLIVLSLTRPNLTIPAHAATGTGRIIII